MPALTDQNHGPSSDADGQNYPLFENTYVRPRQPVLISGFLDRW